MGDLHAIGNEPCFMPPPSEKEGAVWDEPHIAGGARHPDAYAGRFARLFAATPAWKSYLLLALIPLAAGPFAVLCAFAGAASQGMATLTQVLGAVLLAPLTEELGKAGVALILVETRPWLIRKSALLPLVTALSGLVFATLENLIYLNFYLDAPDPEVVAWRWSVCTALHVSASLLAGLGLARMHGAVVATGEPPRYARAVPWLLAAMILHGIYNLFALLAPFAWKWG